MKRAPRIIQRALREFAAARASEKTFCPSELARSLGGKNWRDWMPAIRAEAVRLVAAGELRCTQRGVAVKPDTARGPIRLSAVGDANGR